MEIERYKKLTNELIERLNSLDRHKRIHNSMQSGINWFVGISTGTLIWNYTTSDSVRSSPAVVSDRVYVGSYDDFIYCLNASTGSKIWDYETGSDIVSSPAIAGGKVYIGSDDNHIYCLDADTGAQIWNYTTSGAGHSSPQRQGRSGGGRIRDLGPSG